MCRAIYFLVLVFCTACFSSAKKTVHCDELTPVVVCKTCEDDSIFLHAITPMLDTLRGKSREETLVAIMDFFLGARYASATLERSPETLVINLREFDCSSYWDNVLALHLLLCSESPLTINNFGEVLLRLRYKELPIRSYASRNHYSSEWLAHNINRGVLKDLVSPDMGVKFCGDINFMSQNAAKYPALSDSNVLNEIRHHESLLGQDSFYYIPQNKIRPIQKHIKDGDLIAFVTNISGLDIAHVGFARWRAGELFVQHASSEKENVTISTEPLCEYVNTKKHLIGIRIVRITGGLSKEDKLK